MTHQTIDYKDKTDDDAVADIREWMSDKQWDALCTMRDQCLRDLVPFDMIVMGLEIAGVKGFPVHAFGRTFCPEQYNVWINGDS